MTPFDTYLEATRNPVIDIGKSMLIAGLISGGFMTVFYLLATYIATKHETRAQRIKRLYNHRFVKNLKRYLL